MRLSADYIKSEDGMREAKELKHIEWQEFFIACNTVAHRYFEMQDYENALSSFIESVDVIERFMYTDKQGYDAYPIGGTHANHAITILDIATCLFRLSKTNEIDELIEKSKHIYFHTYDHIELHDYNKTMSQMIEYFTNEYNNRQLNEYKPLNLIDIVNRINEHDKK